MNLKKKIEKMKNENGLFSVFLSVPSLTSATTEMQLRHRKHIFYKH